MKFIFAAICGVIAYFLYPKGITNIPVSQFSSHETARMIGAILFACCGIAILLKPPPTHRF